MKNKSMIDKKKKRKKFEIEKVLGMAKHFKEPFERDKTTREF